MGFKSAIKLMDIKTFVAGLVPVILGSIYSKYAFGPLPISYTPIGEIVSGVTMGIGITTTVIYIQSGIVNLSTILVAVPTAVFIGTVLLTNNLSDIDEDREAGRKTLTIIIDRKNAEKLWIFNVIILLVLTFGLVLMHIYPIVILVPAILLYPYKSVLSFLSYEKSINTKGRSMGLIGQIGLKYHLAVVIGLLIAIIL